MYTLIYFIVPTEIPPVENLTVADQCNNITAKWSVTEGPCIDLYNVTLSSDGVILQGPFTITDTVYNFTVNETYNGTFDVSVGNERGGSMEVINVG